LEFLKYECLTRNYETQKAVQYKMPTSTAQHSFFIGFQNWGH